MLTFKDYTTIDFGNAAFTNWPGTTGDQFPVDNGRYDIDLGLTIDGNVVIEGGAGELQVHNVKL